MVEEECEVKPCWACCGDNRGGLAFGRACTNAMASRWLSWPTVGSVFTGTLARVQPAGLDVTIRGRELGT